MSADSAQITVEGDEELARTLGNAQDGIADYDQLENARLVQQRAAARAPKVSGTLAGSITAKSIGKGVAVAQSDLIYAPVIHYGWAGHNIAPQPFLTTALTDSQTIVEANTLRHVNIELGKVRGA